MPKKLPAVPKPKQAKPAQAKAKKSSELNSTPDLAHIAEGLRPLAVPVGELEFDPANARTHGEENLKAIRASLRAYGQRRPLVVNKRTGLVEAGNGTLRAALALGWAHVAAVYVDDDPTTAAGYAIADNRTAELADWDAEALDQLLRTVSDHGDEDLGELFSQLAEAEKLIPADDANGQAAGDAAPIDLHDEDNPEAEFLAPFPWFGGKSRVAGFVWKCLGDVPNYIEPFFGSGATLLHRPLPFEGVETVNDFDGLVCNFWRALQADPKAVVKYADWPINENDLHARHLWLVNQKETLQARLEGDPDYFDSKSAGWWCWGMACWIGGGFCSGNGPWRVVEEDGVRQLVHLSDAGQGVNRQIVHLANAGRGVKRQRVHLSDAGQGVKRQIVHLGSAGRGVKRQRVHLSDAGQGVKRQRVAQEGNGKAGRGEQGLLAWMEALAERLKRVRVCCGDWTRVCGGVAGDALQHFFASGQTCGVFLDPPYADTADRDPNLYRVDSESVAHAVRAWAIRHGNDERLRIVLAGYEGEHQMPKTWRCFRWKTQGGMGSIGKKTTKGKDNVHRERLWISPHCLAPYG